MLHLTAFRIKYRNSCILVLSRRVLRISTNFLVFPATRCLAALSYQLSCAGLPLQDTQCQRPLRLLLMKRQTNALEEEDDAIPLSIRYLPEIDNASLALEVDPLERFSVGDTRLATSAGRTRKLREIPLRDSPRVLREAGDTEASKERLKRH
jgi:hypothetical protein